MLKQLNGVADGTHSIKQHGRPRRHAAKRRPPWHPSPKIKRERHINEEDCEAPAGVVRQRHSEPRPSITPSPGIEKCRPDWILRPNPRHHDASRHHGKREDMRTSELRAGLAQD